MFFGLPGGHFDRAQLWREFVEHAVDEFMAVGAAKGFGELNSFVDDDL